MTLRVLKKIHRDVEEFGNGYKNVLFNTSLIANVFCRQDEHWHSPTRSSSQVNFKERCRTIAELLNQSEITTQLFVLFRMVIGCFLLGKGSFMYYTNTDDSREMWGEGTKC